MSRRRWRNGKARSLITVSLWIKRYQGGGVGNQGLVMSTWVGRLGPLRKICSSVFT